MENLQKALSRTESKRICVMEKAYAQSIKYQKGSVEFDAARDRKPMDFSRSNSSLFTCMWCSRMCAAECYIHTSKIADMQK